MKTTAQKKQVQKGHIARECPSRNRDEQVHVNVKEEESEDDEGENLFVQQKNIKGVADKNYLLLDNHYH